MKPAVLGFFVALFAAVMLSGLATGVAVVGLVGATGPNLVPPTAAQGQPPPTYLALYRQAADTCPGLPWTIVAAIGTVESANGTSNAPGVHSGANAAGAEGPMQFEPATFFRYANPVPPQGAAPPSPYDPTDAVYAAARDLCANGARNGANLSGAIFAYNHARWYVDEVMALAKRYQAGGGLAPSRPPN